MAAIKIFSEYLDYEEQKMEELGEKSATQTSKDRKEFKENAGLFFDNLVNLMSFLFHYDLNFSSPKFRLWYYCFHCSEASKTDS
jgi:hypothetical protein